MAATLLLESMLRGERFKPHWRICNMPAPSPSNAGKLCMLNLTDNHPPPLLLLPRNPLLPCPHTVCRAVRSYCFIPGQAQFACPQQFLLAFWQDSVHLLLTPGHAWAAVNDALRCHRHHYLPIPYMACPNAQHFIRCCSTKCSDNTTLLDFNVVVIVGRHYLCRCLCQ